MSKISYRPDVDGLRALAILPVLLFHVGVPGFGGGFVGVDVFFVISGFLITSIIAREVESHQFSFLEFWSRRARRILPASVVMILVTLLAGWFVLAPADYVDLGRSAREQAYFAANFYFWQESGYFDGPSEFKPLLHTWSLAVEEQFYLVFPLLFIVAHRFFSSFKFAFFVLVFLSSLLASIVLLEKYPSATFYLLHTRAWELLVGGLIAIFPTHRSAKPWVSETISLTGLSMIVYAVVFYDHSTAFPGAAAILPALGSGAVIWANGHQRTLVARMLSLRLLVAVGLISYSLYLYHWPLIVFTRYASISAELNVEDKILLVGVSFVLAYLSWKYIEGPFRRKTLLKSNREILVVSLAVLLVIAVVGQWVRKADGFPERLSEQALGYAKAANWASYQRQCYRLSAEDIQRGEACRFGATEDNSPRVLFWGDSHAAAYLPGVKLKAIEHGVQVLHASDSACPPVIGAERENDSECVAFNRTMRELINEQGITDVLLAARWESYVYGVAEGEQVDYEALQRGNLLNSAVASAFTDSLDNMLAELRRDGVRVWITTQVPWHEGIQPVHELTKLAMRGMDVSDLGTPLSRHLERQAFVNSHFANLTLQDSGIRVLDPLPYVCIEDFCPVAKKGVSLYKDADHLSVRGAEMAANMFDPLFQLVAENK